MPIAFRFGNVHHLVPCSSIHLRATRVGSCPLLHAMAPFTLAARMDVLQFGTLKPGVLSGKFSHKRYYMFPLLFPAGCGKCGVIIDL